MSIRFFSIRFWSVCLGNLFEHYDTALYGFLSPFLAPLFFPKQDPITALILTYAMIPLGMLARPFGALFFGRIGDRYGRERSLFFSLFGMAIASLAIAFCPTYAEVGVTAPIFLCLAKVCQNFLGAGEGMGGAIFLFEGSSPKRHDLLSSLYAASTLGGILLASALVFLFGHFHWIDQSWRLLYILGSITALFGCFFRIQLPKNGGGTPSVPFEKTWKTLWEMRGPLALIALTSGFSYATYSVSLILMNGFIPLVSSLTKETMLSVNTFLLILDFASLPLFGWLASKMQREKLMLSAALICLLSALPLSMVLEGAGLWTVVLVRICFVLVGVAFFAPYHAFAQQLVPASHRYLIISFGYALGSQLLGGPTSAISLWLFRETGMISSITWYWALLAFATAAVMAVLMKRPAVEEISA